MYAVIKSGGKQYKVTEGETLTVEKLAAETGAEVTFEDVLCVGSDTETVADAKVLEKATVKATVVEQFKDDKILVFKYKAKKGYKKMQGHRQNLTKVKIESISRGQA
jgi:large subunit ribosomal protein L21